MANETIKQIKVGNTTHDIAVKVENVEGLADAYATKTEVGDIATALTNIIAQTNAIIGGN